MADGNQEGPSANRNRAAAVIILVLEVAYAFIYGFSTEYSILSTTSADFSFLTLELALVAILPLLGWSLIAGYCQNSAIAGLTTGLLSAGVVVQYMPLVLELWSVIFNNSYVGRIPLVTNPYFTLSFNSMVSLMVAFCFLVGRIDFLQTIVTMLIFLFGWSANYNLNGWLMANKFPGILTFDSIGSDYIYLFAGVVGLIASWALAFRDGKPHHLAGSRPSVLLGLIGTGFAFASSPFTGFHSFTAASFYETSLNVYFSLTASVITTYAFSAIFGGFKVGIREVLVGLLGGVAILAAVSSFINNIGACITVGAFAGAVCGFWLRVVQPKLNDSKCYDQLGLAGPIVLNAFFGASFVAPIVMGAYQNRGLNPSTVNISGYNYHEAAKFYLVIFGITLAIAIITAAILGLVLYFLRRSQDDHRFTKLVSNDFGLFREEARQDLPPAPSTTYLQNDRHAAGL